MGSNFLPFDLLQSFHVERNVLDEMSLWCCLLSLWVKVERLSMCLKTVHQSLKKKCGKAAYHSTFALFIEPDWNGKLNFPEEVHVHKEFIPPNGVLTF